MPHMIMANGILGIIACPMLEDELIYGLTHDPEPKKIYILDNEPATSIRKKMESRGCQYDLISHDEFYAGNIDIGREGYHVVIDMNKLGLHAEPKELKDFVEKQIGSMQPYVDAVGVYYGICGNYGWDITEWCKERNYKPAAVFRDNTGRICDDCVGVCVGGGERYLKLEMEHTGMFYVTPAIADNWQEFMGDSDVAKQVKGLTPDMMKFLGLRGPDDYARWLFSVGGYTTILQLDNGLEEDRTHFDRKVEEISKKVKLKILEAEPYWPTLQPAIDLYNNCKKMLT